ncbi:hypothetical protein RHSIM_Rhsim01G0188700 [Rhododendron simsii]|uniref:non-specific serine/threonine protein kinase n=1 Tax=Rhododendron simsii TaxID=118357 RepID=A0A834HIU3_RHOSS|nr:hypothetical protein RHSIM_Rhsim01G0188700 [Rhododendron simsii]
MGFMAWIDWVHIVSYDYHLSTVANFTGAHSALYDPSSNISTDYGIKEWISRGLPADKMVLGLAYHGYAWTLVDPTANEIGSPARGRAITLDGSMFCKFIKSYMKCYGEQVGYNSTYVMNYCISGLVWIGYDDVEAIRTKASYAREKGLLGYIVWQVSNDDNWVLSKAEFLRHTYRKCNKTTPAAQEEGKDQGNNKVLWAILQAMISVVTLLLGTLTWYFRRMLFKWKVLLITRIIVIRKKSQYPNLKAFGVTDIKTATSNFSHENKLVEGGFGPVYKVLCSCSSLYCYVVSYTSIQSFTRKIVDNCRREIMSHISGLYGDLEAISRNNNSTASQGRGACGFNSICTIDDYRRPNCSCPEGFSLLNPNDEYGDYKPSFTPSCEEDDHKSSNGDLYDLSVLIDTDWPLYDYEQLKPFSEEMCRNSCLQDCFCAVAILRGDSCWKKDSVVNGKAFMKFRKGDLPPSTTDPHSPFRDIKKNDRTLILVGSMLLGSSLFVNVALLGAFCLGFSLIYQKKILNSRHGFGAVETNLRCFSYEELAEATDGFKEELGRGAFGIVYGGAVQMGNSRTSVAVKKLDRVVQEKEREKEFRTEVHVIGQTHHKNLVRLVGFCDQWEQRMLVYEFMSNGTLASFLFGETKPSWNQSSEIALGIARGLLYLHEECSTQIIHCDIKPQNILLDDYYSARIADFGLATLLMINQRQTNSGIRGIKGYVAPEWFRNKLVTTKVDVYSFGMLLLEIITC